MFPSLTIYLCHYIHYRVSIQFRDSSYHFWIHQCKPVLSDTSRSKYSASPCEFPLGCPTEASSSHQELNLNCFLWSCSLCSLTRLPSLSLLTWKGRPLCLAPNSLWQIVDAQQILTELMNNNQLSLFIPIRYPFLLSQEENTSDSDINI